MGEFPQPGTKPDKRLKRNWSAKKKREVRIKKKDDTGSGEPKQTRIRKQSGCKRLKQD